MRRFIESQISALNAFFGIGMTGVAKEHDVLIAQAAMDFGWLGEISG